MPSVTILSLLGAGLAALCAFVPIGPLSTRVAVSLCVGAPLLGVVHAAPGKGELAAQLMAMGALALLGWRHQERAVPWVAGVLSLALVGRTLAAAVEPGVLFVLMAFAGIPVGTGLAVRCERLRRDELTPSLETAQEPEVAAHHASEVP